MALMSYRFSTFLALCLLFCSVVHGGRDKLTPDFYGVTCQNLQTIVRTVVEQEIQSEARVGAFLLRLFFHDCFVQGCDASILLDDVLPFFTGEKTAAPNVDLDRAYDVIDKIKAQVEASCKATVSCADIIALAARDSVNVLGGPTWNVFLGRLDSRTANRDEANSALPGPGASLSDLVTKFTNKGLTAKDITVLSGAHTIGRGRCGFFRDRIYNDKNINGSFAELRQQTCPQSGGDDNLAPSDVATPDVFDNGYYVDLVDQKGLFHADQELFNNGSQDGLVLKYSKDQTAFFTDFAVSMVNLGALSSPPASVKAKGEVRLNCRRVN